ISQIEAGIGVRQSVRIVLAGRDAVKLERSAAVGIGAGVVIQSSIIAADPHGVVAANQNPGVVDDQRLGAVQRKVAVRQTGKVREADIRWAVVDRRRRYASD